MARRKSRKKITYKPIRYIGEYVEPEEQEQPTKKKPLIIIGAFLLIFILLALSIPVSKIKTDPEPNRAQIPSVATLLTDLALIGYANSTSEYLLSLDQRLSIADMPLIREASVAISTQACSEKPGKVCYVKALYYFTRDKIKYVEDPQKQYIQHPVETLVSSGGDCEDKTFLLGYLLKAIGISSRICLTSNHAFLEAWLPEALPGYKIEQNWIALDAASNMDFGEMSWRVTDASCRIYI